MWLVGVVIRRYIDILIIIINISYSTCIRSFFGSSILTSLFIYIYIYTRTLRQPKKGNKVKQNIFFHVRTKVAVFKAITLTIEPKPAGPTFARCALRGAHAGPNGPPMDTNIYHRVGRLYK